ncbi:septum formation initiator family protein [Cohnella sp.]|uniref:FtsB family cell division protein n=1 Tax=Cohnella sp. TaxID=1883426 RepID=UPI00356B37BE
MSSGTLSATPAITGARRRLKLLLVVIVLFMCWAVYILFTQHLQISDRSGQLQESKKKLTDAETKSQILQQEIARLNDPEYISQIARKEQGLGFPGEIPITIEKNDP